MAKIVCGFGSSHGPLLSTPPERWDLRAADDRKNPKHPFRGGVYTFPELGEILGHRIGLVLGRVTRRHGKGNARGLGLHDLRVDGGIDHLIGAIDGERGLDVVEKPLVLIVAHHHDDVGVQFVQLLAELVQGALVAGPGGAVVRCGSGVLPNSSRDVWR